LPVTLKKRGGSVDRKQVIHQRFPSLGKSV
jgi:hypothetical protein